MLDHRLSRYDQASFMEQFSGSVFMSDESRAFVERRGEALLQLVWGRGAAGDPLTGPVPPVCPVPRFRPGNRPPDTCGVVADTDDTRSRFPPAGTASDPEPFFLF